MNYTFTTNTPPLYDKEGIINGYKTSIIRPPIANPQDIQRSSLYRTQQAQPPIQCSTNTMFCNEKQLQTYHAMRPIMTPEEYNNQLRIMFRLMVTKSPEGPVGQEAQEAPEDWVPIQKNIVITDKYVPDLNSCDANTTLVIRIIMNRINYAVTQMPEFQQNSTYKYEMFTTTDQTVYKSGSYLKVIFMLHNYMRSVSTLLQATLKMDYSKNMYDIISVDFVDKFRDTSGAFEGASPLSWSFSDTLVLQEYNQYGFFQPNNNVSVVGGLPESIRSKVASNKNFLH